MKNTMSDKIMSTALAFAIVVAIFYYSGLEIRFQQDGDWGLYMTFDVNKHKEDERAFNETHDYKIHRSSIINDRY